VAPAALPRLGQPVLVVGRAGVAVGGGPAVPWSEVGAVDIGYDWRMRLMREYTVVVRSGAERGVVASLPVWAEAAWRPRHSHLQAVRKVVARQAPQVTVTITLLDRYWEGVGWSESAG
jgi:hypothetical protein